MCSSSFIHEKAVVLIIIPLLFWLLLRKYSANKNLPKTARTRSTRVKSSASAQFRTRMQNWINPGKYSANDIKKSVPHFAVFHFV